VPGDLSRFTGRLRGPVAKVERAKKHAADLDAEIRCFRSGDAYTVVIQENEEANQRQWVVTNVRPMPTSLSLIYGDAIHNLRSALDLLARQLVLDNGGKPRDKRIHGKPRTCFPISDGRRVFKPKSLGEISGISQDAIKVLNAVRPYKRGNDALWRIHQLDIVDKHRLLVTVGDRYHSIDIGLPASFIQLAAEQGGFDASEIKAPPIQFGLQNPIFPLQDGQILFAEPLDIPQEHDPKFILDIAVHEPGIVDRETLDTLLASLVDEVERTLEAFAAIMQNP
jgi:hypothetical protein